MPRLAVTAVWLAVLSMLPGVLAHEPDDSWPSFRGPDRTGVSKDTGLLQRWQEGGPPLAWKADGAGRGYASLAIANGRIFTLGDAPSTAPDSDEYLVCLSEDGGKPICAPRPALPGPAEDRIGRVHAARPPWMAIACTR